MLDFEKNPKLDVFKSDLTKGAFFSPKYEFPILKQVHFKPQKAVPFHEALNEKNKNTWIHFYIDDYRFESVWNNPAQYLMFLKRLGGVITPDYSVCRDFPLVMQMWNTYRNRAFAYWLQNNGVNIIPNISWGDERTYDFAFEGIAQGGTVAVSTNGCIKDPVDRYYFKQGLDKMIRVLKPETIICYSQCPDDIFGEHREAGLEIIHIENHWETVKKAVR